MNIAKAENIESIQKNVTLVLGALLALFLALYAFYISSAISNVIARERLAKETSALNASAAGSEQKYVSLKDSVTAELATSLGFVAAPELTFVSASPQTKVLSVNTR